MNKWMAEFYEILRRKDLPPTSISNIIMMFIFICIIAGSQTEILMAKSSMEKVGAWMVAVACPPPPRKRKSILWVSLTTIKSCQQLIALKFQTFRYLCSHLWHDRPVTYARDGGDGGQGMTKVFQTKGSNCSSRYMEMCTLYNEGSHISLDNKTA